VSANETRAIPTAPATRAPRSWAGTLGSWNDGSPLGSGPTTETPYRSARPNTPTATVAPTTATSTPGTLGRHRLHPRITARQATPMTSAARLVSPSATPRSKARVSGITPSASTEKPKSLGSWLSSTVSAIPFM
jgi:hypothetical protein